MAGQIRLQLLVLGLLALGALGRAPFAHQARRHNPFAKFGATVEGGEEAAAAAFKAAEREAADAQRRVARAQQDEREAVAALDSRVAAKAEQQRRQRRLAAKALEKKHAEERAAAAAASRHQLEVFQAAPAGAAAALHAEPEEKMQQNAFWPFLNQQKAKKTSRKPLTPEEARKEALKELEEAKKEAAEARKAAGKATQEDSLSRAFTQALAEKKVRDKSAAVARRASGKASAVKEEKAPMFNFFWSFKKQKAAPTSDSRKEDKDDEESEAAYRAPASAAAQRREVQSAIIDDGLHTLIDNLKPKPKEAVLSAEEDANATAEVKKAKAPVNPVHGIVKDMESSAVTNDYIQYWKKSFGKFYEAFTDDSFPLMELIGFLGNMTADDFDDFKVKFTETFSKVKDVLNIVAATQDFMDPAKVSKLGPIGEGLYSLLHHVNHSEVREKKMRIHEAKKEKRMAERAKRFQTPEELAREAISRRQFYDGFRAFLKKVQNPLYMKDETIDLLCLEFSGSFAKIMQWRKNGDSKRRLFVDRIAGIWANATTDFVKSDINTLRDMRHVHKDFSRAFGPLWTQLEQAMYDYGYKRAAMLINATTPVASLVQKIGHLRHDGRFDIQRFSRLFAGIAELPVMDMLDQIEAEENQAAVAQGASKAAMSKVNSTRQNLRAVAKLLDVGSAFPHRHKSGQDIRKELSLQVSDDTVPFLADVIMFVDDLATNHTEWNVTQIAADGVSFLDYLGDGGVARQQMMGFMRMVDALWSTAGKVPMTKDNVPLFLAVLAGKLHILPDEALTLIADVVKKVKEGTFNGEFIPRILAVFADSFGLYDEFMVSEGAMSMRWALLFACSIDKVAAAKKSMCKAYRGSAGVNLIKAAQAARLAAFEAARNSTENKASVELEKKSLRGSGKAAGDVSALVQRSVVVAHRPPFPGKQLTKWVAEEFPNQYLEVKGVLDMFKTIGQIAQIRQAYDDSMEYQHLFEGIGNAFSHKPSAGNGDTQDVSDKKADRAAQKKADAEKQREELRAQRRASRKTPPPKQTPDEKFREKETRANVANKVEQFLKPYNVPGMMQASIVAAVVPPIMESRRHSGHKKRMLLDLLSNISLPVFSLNDTQAAWQANLHAMAATSMEALEALSTAGYQSVFRTVNKGRQIWKFMADIRDEMAKMEAHLPVGDLVGVSNGTWRLIDDAAAVLRNHSLPLALMVNISRVTDTIETKSMQVKKLIDDLKAETARGDAPMTVEALQRLLADLFDVLPRNMALSDAVPTLKRVLIANAKNRHGENWTSLADLAGSLRGRDKVGAQLLLNASVILKDSAGLLVPMMDAWTGEKNLTEASFKGFSWVALLRDVANVMDGLSRWSEVKGLPDDTRNGMKKTALALTKLADYKQGKEAESIQFFANQITPGENATKDAVEVVDTVMNVMCAFKGVKGVLEGCEEYQEAAAPEEETPRRGKSKKERRARR